MTVRLGRCGSSNDCFREGQFGDNADSTFEYNSVKIDVPSDSPSYQAITAEEPTQRLSMSHRSTPSLARLTVGVFRNNSLSQITYTGIDITSCQASQMEGCGKQESIVSGG